MSALVDLLEKRCFLGGTYLWYVQIVQIGLLIRNRVSSNIPVSLAGRGVEQRRSCHTERVRKCSRGSHTFAITNAIQKMSCGRFALLWLFLVQKLRLLQWVCRHVLLKTGTLVVLPDLGSLLCFTNLLVTCADSLGEMGTSNSPRIVQA